MEVIEAIKTRRSIRKYTGESVTDEQIRELLDAAFCAPSAKNVRPWHFIVVREREMLKKIADVSLYAKMLSEAALGVIVCADSTKHDIIERIMCDISAATENILLAAHGMGLGAVWCGCYPDTDFHKDVHALMEMPEHIMPCAVISIGYPGQERSLPDRYEEEKVHYEKW